MTSEFQYGELVTAFGRLFTVKKDTRTVVVLSPVQDDDGVETMFISRPSVKRFPYLINTDVFDATYGKCVVVKLNNESIDLFCYDDHGYYNREIEPDGTVEGLSLYEELTPQETDEVPVPIVDELMEFAEWLQAGKSTRSNTWIGCVEEFRAHRNAKIDPEYIEYQRLKEKFGHL